MGKVGKSSELRLPRILDFFCLGGRGGGCVEYGMYVLYIP